MPRVDGSSSSAVPPPSTGEASTSQARPHPQSDLRQRPARAREGALAALPPAPANAARVPAADTAVEELPRGRIAATLDRLRGARQVLANAGAQAAHVGVRAGAAAAQYALNHPLFTAGVGGVAMGNYSMQRAERRNDPHAYAGGVSVTMFSTALLALHAGYVVADLLLGNPAPLRVSADMLSDAVNMLNGLDDVDMTAEAGHHALYVIDHLQDIAAVPGNRLHPAVRAAAEQAGGNPQQLIRNLVGVLTGNPPVYSRRRPPPGGPRAPAQAGLVPATLGVNVQTLRRAVDMLTGFAGEHEDMTAEAGLHRQDVIDHLQDIAARPAGVLHPAVRQAAQSAGNNAQRLVRNLVAMLQRDPSILPARRQEPAR